MKKQTHMQFIQKKITCFHVGDPILIHELGDEIAAEYDMDYKKANIVAAVAVNRIIKTKIIPALRCFNKGVYYLTKQTVFGEVGIDKEKLINMKYLSDDNGYETGATIMHKIGLTTLMPTERIFVSNRAQNRTKKDKALGIIVKAPRTTVTRDNRKYLQLLDLLNIYDEVPIDAEKPYAILDAYVQSNELNYEKLLSYADLHYNHNTIIKIAHIASCQGRKI